jgi:hypothetical protein
LPPLGLALEISPNGLFEGTGAKRDPVRRKRR